MSEGPGIMNLSGSEATSASRSSFGKPNPISVSSRDKDRNTIRPTRNFTRSRTSASYEGGRLSASSRTPSIVAVTRSTMRGRSSCDPRGDDPLERVEEAGRPLQEGVPILLGLETGLQEREEGLAVLILEGEGQ